MQKYHCIFDQSWKAQILGHMHDTASIKKEWRSYSMGQEIYNMQWPTSAKAK